MRHVQVTGLIDPSDYLRHLPTFMDQLPTGALRFAADPDHYDLTGIRCVKDLRVSQFSYQPDRGTATIRFTKHDEDLLIEYVGVTRFGFSHQNGTWSGDWSGDWSGETIPDELGEVLLDEILPTEDGCSHEIACLSGSILVHSDDLIARWVRVQKPTGQQTLPWSPQLRLGDRSNWLGLRQDRVWVVGQPRQPAKAVEGAPFLLLTLLERSWPTVSGPWAQLSQPAPDLDLVLRHALNSGEHWAGLAVGWLEQGYPVAGLLADLASLKDDPHYGQGLRHRAGRLWKRHRSR